MRGNTKILTWLLRSAIVVVIFCFLEFLSFETEMKAILITMLFGFLTYLFTYEQKRQDEISNKEKIELENKIRIKTEVYDKFMESLTRYRYRNYHPINSGFDQFIDLQIDRAKMSIYAEDETVKLFAKEIEKTIGDRYDINDPLSKIILAIRKEVNPNSKINANEMLGVDISQWSMEFESEIKLK